MDTSVTLWTMVIFKISSLQILLSASQRINWSCYQETGSCYYLPSDKLNQTEASCWCRSVGGHLVKIDTYQENQVIAQIIQDQRDRIIDGVLIGATDKKNESQFLWADQTEDSGTIPWYFGEPNDSQGNSNCALITDKAFWDNPPWDLGGYYVFDVSCSMDMYFICERNQGFTHSLFFDEVSRDEVYPSSQLTAVSDVSEVACADLCLRHCRCLSFAYRQEDADCKLYDNNFRLLQQPLHSEGYVHFELSTKKA